MISPTSEAEAPLYSIVISEKGGAERREAFSLTELSVGRVQGNDLLLPKGNVSKRHARLLYRDGRFIVTDLNSTNGTYVNRRRIAQATIVREGDRIYIGDFVLRLELGGGDGAEPEISASVAASSPTPAEPLPKPAFDDAFDEEVSGSRAPLTTGATLSALPQMLAQDGPSSRQEPSSPSIERAPQTFPDEKVDTATLAHRVALASVVHAVRSAIWTEVPETEITAAERERVREQVARTVKELAAKGELAPSSEPELLTTQALDQLLSWGPIGPLLEDPDVTDISVMRFDRIVATRRGRSVPVEPPFCSEATLGWALRRLCRHADAPLADGERIVERQLPDKTLLSAVTQPAATSGILMVLRKPRRHAMTLDEIVRRGAASRAMATVLLRCIQARANVLIVGPRDHGAAAVASALSSVAGAHRTISVFDVDDVVAHAEDATRISIRRCGERAADLLEIVTRAPTTRLVIELATPEVAAATVEAVATGADGVVAMLRAPDAARGLARLAAHLAARRPGLDPSAAREWVGQAFDLVLEVSRLRDGRSRVLRLAEVARVGPGGFELLDVFCFTIEHTRATGSVEGTFVATGHIPRVAEQLRLLGVPIDFGAFGRSQTTGPRATPTV